MRLALIGQLKTRPSIMEECSCVRRVMMLPFTVLLLLITVIHCHDRQDQSVFLSGNTPAFAFGEAKQIRYLLYDVNPGEGFNLRRDVYMRVANLVKLLNEEESWTVVLPPWGRLYHWKSVLDQSQIPWSTFFDLGSLSKHIPVIEFADYLKVRAEPVIDEIYYLQRYKEGWTSAIWEEKLDERECLDSTGFQQDQDGRWRAWFWGHDEVYGAKFKCLSVQAQAGFLKPFLSQNTTGTCVFLVRAEELIHGEYSEWSALYWSARRSMVFAKHLRDIGDDFRRKHLDSTDEGDTTVWDDDWTRMKRNHGDAVGGPYIAVHMRRRDFLYGHSEDVPSIKGTAEQIKVALNKTGLQTVFIATDAPKEEVKELKSFLSEFKVVQYKPSKSILQTYKDGGIAIIDQWIAAHARYFIGTSVSTFSFRIHEEREILGFDPKTTFNRLCGDKEKKCEQPTKWLIKY